MILPSCPPKVLGLLSRLIALQYTVFFLFGMYLGVGLLDHRVTLLSVFLGTFKLFSVVAILIYWDRDHHLQRSVLQTLTPPWRNKVTLRHRVQCENLLGVVH